MYGKEKQYKLQLNTGIWYTGKVVDEDLINIKFVTVRDEQLILSKSEIVIALVINNE